MLCWSKGGFPYWVFTPGTTLLINVTCESDWHEQEWTDARHLNNSLSAVSAKFSPAALAGGGSERTCRAVHYWLRHSDTPVYGSRSPHTPLWLSRLLHNLEHNQRQTQTSPITFTASEPIRCSLHVLNQINSATLWQTVWGQWLTFCQQTGHRHNAHCAADKPREDVRTAAANRDRICLYHNGWTASQPAMSTL